MKCEIAKDGEAILANGRRIVVMELLSINMFSRSEGEIENLMNMFQEFFHALNDVRIQIIVQNRILNIDDIVKHLSNVKANDQISDRYIEDLSSLICTNSIPHKKYYLIISNFKESEYGLLSSLKLKLVQIGFRLIEIKDKELISISKDIFND